MARGQCVGSGPPSNGMNELDQRSLVNFDSKKCALKTRWTRAFAAVIARTGERWFRPFGRIFRDKCGLARSRMIANGTKGQVPRWMLGPRKNVQVRESIGKS